MTVGAWVADGARESVQAAAVAAAGAWLGASIAGRVGAAVGAAAAFLVVSTPTGRELGAEVVALLRSGLSRSLPADGDIIEGHAVEVS